jgi:hypothetical protein
MALEVADTHPEGARGFSLAQEQPWLWPLSLHVIVGREIVETTVD